MREFRTSGSVGAPLEQSGGLPDCVGGGSCAHLNGRNTNLIVPFSY